MPRLSPHFDCLVIRANKSGLIIGFLYLSITFTAATATGQTQDQDPKRGAYAGASFASSQIESVNITNGNLLVDLPLVSLPAGRNGLSAGVRLNYNSKLWTTETELFPDCINHLVNQTFLLESNDGTKRSPSGGPFIWVRRTQFNNPSERRTIDVCLPQRWSGQSPLERYSAQLSSNQKSNL